MLELAEVTNEASLEILAHRYRQLLSYFWVLKATTSASRRHGKP